jgi:hypothetical protein
MIWQLKQANHCQGSSDVAAVVKVEVRNCLIFLKPREPSVLAGRLMAQIIVAALAVVGNYLY